MATLEDAAEALLVKLRGLDSEIEESESRLEDLRERIETVTGDVGQEWASLGEAVSSFLHKVRAEQEQLADQVQETAQSIVDAQNAVAEDGAGARQELGDGKAQMEALAQHAAGLAPGVESLASEVGEPPAQSLAERAREMEQELSRLVEQARDFLQDEVAGAAGDAADEIKQVCETLHGMLTDAASSALQKVYDEWESMVDRLEEYVVSQGYDASHQHARDVVEYAMEECSEVSNQHLDELQQVVGVLLGQLKEMAAEVERSAEGLVSQAGTALLDELDRVRRAAAVAAGSLDGVRAGLAAYSFVEV